MTGPTDANVSRYNDFAKNMNKIDDIKVVQNIRFSQKANLRS